MDLPSEIYFKIFSYLSHEDRSTVCMSVCHHWRAVAQDPSFWREIKFENYFSPRMIEAYLKQPFIWETLTKLELVEGQEIPNLSIPHLHTLCVSHFDTEKDLERIQQLPSLTTFRVKCELDQETVTTLHSSEILMRNLSVVIDAVHVRVEEYTDKAMKTLTDLKNLMTRCSVERINLELNMYEESLKKQDILRELFQLVPKTRFLDTPNFNVLREFTLLTDVYLYWITREQAFQVLPATCLNLKYCRLGRIEDGAMPSKVVPFVNLHELDILHTPMPEDVLYRQVLTVWNNLKCLSVSLRSDFVPKLSIISRGNPELTKLSLSTPPSKGRLRSFNGKVTFPALKTLDLTCSSGHQVLELMFLPVVSALTVPATAKDSKLDLSCVSPSVESVYLLSDNMKTGVNLIKPICRYLQVVHAQHAKIFPKGLSGLRSLAGMCSELTELYLRVDTIDPKIFFEDLSRVLNPLKKLRTLRLSIFFPPLNSQELHNEQVDLTDQVLRDCFRSANIMWEVGKRKVCINFVPQALQRNLAGICGSDLPLCANISHSLEATTN